MAECSACWRHLLGRRTGVLFIKRFLLPEDFMIYTREKIGQLVRSGLRPDESGNVFVYNKFWKSNNSNILVPRLLVYADLMGSGYNRNIEAAQKLAKDGL